MPNISEFFFRCPIEAPCLNVFSRLTGGFLFFFASSVYVYRFFLLFIRSFYLNLLFNQFIKNTLSIFVFSQKRIPTPVLFRLALAKYNLSIKYNITPHILRSENPNQPPGDLYMTKLDCRFNR